MGCFDSTCAFTRTSVSAGDEVLLVGIRPREPFTSFDTYNLANEIYAYNVNIEYEEKVEELGRKNSERIQHYNPIRFSVIGTYDDYGSVEVNTKRFDNEVDLDDKYTYYDWQFFVHKAVVEKLLDIIIDEQTNLVDVVKELVKLAMLARIQLSGNCLLGQQHYDKQELQLQRKLLNVTDRILADKLVALQEYDDD